MSPVSETTPHIDPKTALIGVDWGTSSLRAYRLDADGRILESVHTDKGILSVGDGDFAKTLEATIGSWRTPELSVLLSGMIGSRQGWLEVPYLLIPARLDDLATALVNHPADPAIHLVPGLAQDLPDQAPDVMRGEETQIIGTIGAIGDGSDTKSACGDGGGHHLLVMPGTHSKWVLVEHGRITWFATFMTGELFAVLKDHSILGRLMAADGGPHDQDAFELGLSGAKTRPGGLLQKLFSARTLPLFERLPAAGIASYLSGLLIGSEVDEALGNLQDKGRIDQASITVIGASALAERYLDAIEQAGLRANKAGDDAAARGHYLIARTAKLFAK